MTNDATNALQKPLTAYVVRESPITKRTRRMCIKRYDQDEFEKRWTAVRRGDVAFNDAFPDVTAEQKLFMTTGMTEEEIENR
jgi:hypothetical protein